MFDYGLRLLLMATNTGGGGYIDGDAKAGRDFTGRDTKQVDGGVTFNTTYGAGTDGRQPQTTEERVEWLLIIVDGDQRLGVVGIRNHIRSLRTQLRITLWILIGVSIVVFAELAAILILLRRLG